MDWVLNDIRWLFGEMYTKVTKVYNLILKDEQKIV